MNYSIKLHPTVAKFIDKTQAHIAQRIRTKLLLLLEDPFTYLEHYEGQDFYKLRIGNVC